MNTIFRATCVGLVGAAASASLFLACSSSSSSGVTPTGDGGSGGDGSMTVDGGGGRDGGGDGATRTPNVGVIEVTQAVLAGGTTSSASASFARGGFVMGTPTPCPQAVNIKMGNCLASVICVPPATDAGMAVAKSGLNAGPIMVGGGTGDAGPATLTYGTIPASMPPVMGYLPFDGTTLFYAGGDIITASGAGGPDLPAFAATPVTAPNDIMLTAPAGCSTGACPDLDRMVDLTATWTGGGAGKVFVTYETLSSALVSIVSCNFPAAGGTGTVPSALLANLEKGTDAGTVTAIYAIGPINESAPFMVGDVPTTLSVQGTGFSGLLTISR